MNKIKKDDIVTVYLDDKKRTLCKKAKILHTPQTNDLPPSKKNSWGFEDLITGITYHVFKKCTITKLKL